MNIQLTTALRKKNKLVLTLYQYHESSLFFTGAWLSDGRFLNYLFTMRKFVIIGKLVCISIKQLLKYPVSTMLK